MAPGRKKRRQALPAAPAEQAEGQQGPLTTIHDLPDAVLGLIWEKIKDNRSRAALRRTCRAFKTSPSICARIESLCVPKGFGNSNKACEEVLEAVKTFPSIPCVLRRVRLLYTGQAWALLKALCRDRAAVLKLKSVETLGMPVSAGSVQGSSV